MCKLKAYCMLYHELRCAKLAAAMVLSDFTIVRIMITKIQIIK
jgi:hypothetical protein